MPRDIFFSPILDVERFQGSAVVNVLTGAVNSFSNDVKKDYEKTVKTWNTEVTFEREFSVKQFDGFFASVYTRSRLYRWINNGTDVRYATMTRDFIPKTRPGVIDSGPGRGGVLMVSRSNPRPGIKARRFDLAIRRKWERRFRERMDDAMIRAAQRSRHAL